MKPQNKSEALFTALTALLNVQPFAHQQKVRVVTNPMHTRNLFGPLSEIAGKQLELLERNARGDCLCLFDGQAGKNIVDVDYRDIESANLILGAPHFNSPK